MADINKIFSTLGDFFHTAGGNKRDSYFVSAIIAAGGSSTRLGGDTTKQMMTVCGLPVIVHTLLAFENCPRISEIVVVAKEDEVDRYADFAREHGITKFKVAVKGGSTRQESVLNGFNATNEKADFVAIHDGARCLITPDEIDKVLLAAYKYGAATASVSAFDTVKLADSKGFISETVDRTKVRLAQTPQVFGRTLYCAAAYTAREEGFEATDDCMLCERINQKIKLVECSRENIKITTAQDIKTAERILSGRKEVEGECSE